MGRGAREVKACGIVSGDQCGAGGGVRVISTIYYGASALGRNAGKNVIAAVDVDSGQGRLGGAGIYRNCGWRL